MIIIPLKCKLCGKTISPPHPAGGYSDEQYRGAYTAKLMGHLTGHAKEESTTGGPHAQGNAEAAIPAQNLYTALLMGCFDLTPEMEQDRTKVFAMIHALTRTVRVSDADLQTLFRDGLNRIKRGETSDRTPILPCGAPGYNCAPDFFMMLCDLRDRYEECGKYAQQATTVAESGTNES